MTENSKRPVVLSRPDNWDKMTREQKVEWSRQFIAALRSKK